MSNVKEVEPLIKDQKNITAWSSLQELMSDLLGALMPGILFLFVILTSSYLLVYTLLKSSIQLDPIVNKILDSMSLEISISFFVFAYIIGSVFYRKDPKEPDGKSARYIWKMTSEADRKSLAVQQLPDGTFNVEYPYLHIYEYLCSRGYYHLARHINWRGNDVKTYRKRSKMLINILKTRINYYGSKCMSEITKNEAHIRLISSLWYCIKWILYFMVAISIISIGSLFVSVFDHVEIASMIPLALNVGSLIIIFVGIRQSIIKFFHYQRVREIVIVLETAHIISLENGKIFKFDADK